MAPPVWGQYEPASRSRPIRAATIVVRFIDHLLFRRAVEASRAASLASKSSSCAC